MSFGSRLARALCRLPIRLLVNHRSLPEDPVSQLGLDPARPIVYALNTDSLSDLLTLELCTRELGLPSPFTPLQWQGQSHPRYVCLDRTPLPFGLKRRTAPNLATFQEWLALHQHDSQLDVQLVPVTLLWQRAPGRERRQRLQPPPAKTPHALHKALIVALYGRENRVRFSLPVSLRQLVNELGYDEQVAHKLARVARIHFSRQRQAAKGPRLPDRRALFNELLRNDNIVQAIREQNAQFAVGRVGQPQREVEVCGEVALEGRTPGGGVCGGGHPFRIRGRACSIRDVPHRDGNVDARFAPPVLDRNRADTERTSSSIGRATDS